MPVNQMELAKIAGVSQVTVSRVLRGHPSVTPELRDRVLAAREQCGYYPRADALAMRRGRFKQIACVVTRFGPKGTSHATYNGYLDPAVDHLCEQGYSTIFETLHLDDTTRQFLEAPRVLSALLVDGILGIVSATPVLDFVDNHLAQLGAPVVWVNRDPQPGIVSVVCDDFAGGRMLARHLIDLGHERIGYVGGKGNHYSTHQRGEGVREELRSARLDTSYIRYTEFEHIEVAVERVLDQEPRITALVCYNLQFFHVTMQAVAMRGWRVPQDLSICHFASAWEIPVFANYPATIVTVPELQMAKAAVDILMDTIKGSPQPINLQAIPGVLCPGITTARPGAQADRTRAGELREQRGLLARRTR